MTTYRSKTEAVFAGDLQALKLAGEIVDWKYEPMTFKLADGCRYTPDFMVVRKDREIEFIEIKGFMREDAAVKFKVVVESFPWFHWKMIRRQKGGWVEVYDR